MFIDVSKSKVSFGNCIMTSGKEKKLDRQLSSSRYLLITFLISQRRSAKYNTREKMRGMISLLPKIANIYNVLL